MNEQPKGTILSGYHILDLADEKGMLCSRLLADMGADVVRVEKAGEGSDRSPFFTANNLGKRAVMLNLGVKSGQELFRRLVKLEAFDAESLEALLRPLAAELGLKTGQLFGTLRVAVTGRTAAPPLFQTMAVLGKERCLKRIEAALDILRKLSS